MKKLPLILLLLLPVILWSQSTTQKETQVHVDKMPQYPAGTKALAKLFLDSIDDPSVKWEEVDDSDNRSQLVLSLLIDEHGNVEDVKVIKSLNARNDARCVNLARKLKFIPAMLGGKAVRVHYKLALDLEF